MSFLRGRWLCDRGLVRKSDGHPIIVLYDFDSSGRGTVTVRLRDAQSGREDCTGSVVASMSARGTLIIKAERLVCPDGQGGYAAETVECVPDANNRAMCRGRSDTGADWGESVPFYRVY
jgi:hypothetical protein